MSTKKKQGTTPSKATTQQVDSNPFSKYSLNYQTPAQKVLQWGCMLFIVFSLLGLTWALPFPYLKFLGNYNGFFNWSSFLIAAAVYYYYQKFPSLSFIIFFMFFVFTYGIIQVAEWQKRGGPSLLLISAVIFIIAAGLQFANLKLKNKKPSVADGLQFLIISPVWAFHFLFKKKA
ncbi:MAG TPA: hypothetical protein VHA56_17650 [Mucilaginibacter sp.]|nr:hypothetical protein [Mucilaginibacter sp.]